MSLGFFGGFSHCIAMCSPFVLSQVSTNLKNISLKNYSNFEKLKGIALLPYHCGRITTYSILGFLSSLITTNLKDKINFNYISGVLLLIAAVFFIKNFFDLNSHFKIKFPKIKIRPPFKASLNNLFKNPQGFNGFLLGIILGFIPCGLLYGAFALAATIKPPIFAAFAMMMFGIMTIPALFVSAIGGYAFFKNNNNFRLISKIIILINIITLLIMSVDLLLM